ncbi:type II toxin-antitoxin system PemK/MazF family toxin [Burkholderia sp. YIM B11467]
MLNGVPEAGDVIRLYIGPSKGNEQDGYRAVVVITPADINELTGRIVGLPITSSGRGWESEIPISSLARNGGDRSVEFRTLALQGTVRGVLDQKCST